jgi:hypothetical protein
MARTAHSGFCLATLALLWGFALPAPAGDGQRQAVDRQQLQRQLQQDELRLQQQQSQETGGLQLKPAEQRNLQRFELRQQQQQRQLHQEQMGRRIQLEQTLRFNAEPQRQMQLQQQQQQQFEQERASQQLRFQQEMQQWQLNRRLGAPK